MFLGVCLVCHMCIILINQNISNDYVLIIRVKQIKDHVLLIMMTNFTIYVFFLVHLVKITIQLVIVRLVSDMDTDGKLTMTASHY